MKHLIMGTAGHIDHGKTALIKALTQIDCDTHKEEKRRGITINLGFAHLNLPSGESIGIVDVPGHKDFVHTMVSGASGIDFVLMVVAADSGVMPQTIEHLQIMEILGIKQGLIAVTKKDLVEDEELLELTLTDIQELVKGTFLENCPVAKVSIKTGEGLDTLTGMISKTIKGIQPRSHKGTFRMYIDRMFSVSGFGTVVTGSVISGQLKVKDKVHLLPGKQDELQVRRLERHGQEVSEVFAGDRASINLVGLDKEHFKKGKIISATPLKATTLLDANLHLFNNSPELGIWSQTVFHTGTFINQAKIHLIDTNKLRPGKSALVQIHLIEPCVLRYGDRFVLRNSSGDITLGGGEVIDISPLYHRRRPEKLVKKMASIAKGELSELISSETKKLHRAVSLAEIAANMNISIEELQDTIDKKLPNQLKRYEGKNTTILLTQDREKFIQQGVVKAVRDFRKHNPLIKKGASFEEIRGRLRINRSSVEETVLQQIVVELEKSGQIKKMDKTWLLAGDSQYTDREMEAQIQFFSDYLKSFNMQTPSLSQLKIQAQQRNLTDRELKQILFNLTSTGKAYRIKDEYIHASIVDQCREALVKKLTYQKEGITVAQFRDLVGGNRKICLLLLAQYDTEMVTKRVGDVRVLAK